MKHFISVLGIALIATIGFTSSAFAKGPHTQGVVSLPHPVKLILENKNKFGIDKTQTKRLEKEMLAVYPPIIHKKMDAVIALENKLKKLIMSEHKSYAQLETEIKKLSQMKLDLTETHIEALATLRGILTEKQWHLMQKMLAKNKGRKAKHKAEKHDHNHDHEHGHDHGHKH